MIDQNLLIPVGKLYKPHSYKGDVKAELYFDRDVFMNMETPLFVKIENILVPFFVQSISGGAHGTAFIKFKDIDSDEEASIFNKKDIFALKSVVSEATGLSDEELEEIDNEHLVGYKIYDNDTNDFIGVLTGFDSGVEYDYMVVENEQLGKEFAVPFIDEFVNRIEDEEKGSGSIYVDLPEGFLDI